MVDPRFTRTASVADFYAPIRTGTDIAFLGGVINYLLTNDKIQHEYVKNYTDMSFIVREDFAFKDGLFSGYDAEKRKYDKSSWPPCAATPAICSPPSSVKTLMPPKHAPP